MDSPVTLLSLSTVATCNIATAASSPLQNHPKILSSNHDTSQNHNKTTKSNYKEKIEPESKHMKMSLSSDLEPTLIETYGDKLELLSTIFAQLTKHIWFALIENEFKYKTIFDNLSITSSSLYPLMQEIGIIKYYNGKLIGN